MDTTDLHGLTELQAALEQFMAANTSVVSYRADTTKAIVLKAS